MILPGLLMTLIAGAEVRLQPGVAHPGDAVLVEVTGTSTAPSGQLGSTELVFLPRGPDRFVALVGLSVDEHKGTLPLEVTVRSGEGRELLQGALEVAEQNFRKRQLTVSKRFTSISKADRKRSADDQQAFTSATDRDFDEWTFTEDFDWPRLSGITAPFGDLRLLNGKKQSQHFGTDLDGNTGDPVYASNDGEVVMVRDCFASGNTVLVHHGGRLFTSYFHFSATEVKQGQKVKRGQLLGKVGKTGRVTGPHLHWGVKLDGRWVNPESLLNLDF